MSDQIVAALRERGKQRREMAGQVRLARLRRQLRHQHTVRVWRGRILVAIGYVSLTGLSVALIWSL